MESENKAQIVDEYVKHLLDAGNLRTVSDLEKAATRVVDSLLTEGRGTAEIATLAMLLGSQLVHIERPSLQYPVLAELRSRM